MIVLPHLPEAELRAAMLAAKDADHRDRLRAVLLSLRGMGAAEVAEVLSRGPDWVWKCVRSYNQGGPAALENAARPGRTRLLSPEQDERLRGFVEARAQDPAHARRLHGAAAREFIERELGVPMCLSAAYATLHRLGYELIKPRPRHEDNDRAAMEHWKTVTAPLLSKKRGASTRAKTSRSGARTKAASAKKAR